MCVWGGGGGAWGRACACACMCFRTCVRLQETDFLHSTFHLYDSEEEEVEETIEPSDHM